MKRLLALVSAAALGATALAQLAIPGPFLLEIEHDLPAGVDVVEAVIKETNPDRTAGSSAWSFPFSGSGTIDNRFEYEEIPGALTVFGQYEGNGSTGVAVLTRWAFGIEVIGAEWDSVFGPDLSEQEVYDAISDVVSGDSARESLGQEVLDRFFNGNYDLWPAEGERALWLGFTDAKNFGDGRWTANPVPEPGTLLVLAAGAGLLAARRRRA
ncbi:MAG: PEP-CTERM sorting domain-containing protein [Fimbriimonadaceae bacterium]|nr:PEP-CTERM sorting domain-containing protein [Fimbriimonadaceae bacterium]